MTRYLWVYCAADDWTENWHNRLLAQRQARGFDVEHFCLTPPYLNNRNRLLFSKLDYLWRIGDAGLMRMYTELLQKLQGRDVLIHFNGANLHPDFLDQLDVYKVYSCADDPESTDDLSKPVASAYDLHMIQNIACVEMYRSWGLKHTYFWPLGSSVMEEDVADLTAETITDIANRPVPIVFFGELAGWGKLRRERLHRLSSTFPQAVCAGLGWPRGFLSWPEMWATYRKAQIGWNVHNSTGPINFRTYDLAAYGIMQICDNKTHLGQIYTIGSEVQGFDSVEDCIELTHYYLQHPDEQRQLALGGWKRWQQDYAPARVWDKLINHIEQHFVPRQPFAETGKVQAFLQKQRTMTRIPRVYHKFKTSPPAQLARKVKRRLFSRA